MATYNEKDLNITPAPAPSYTHSIPLAPSSSWTRQDLSMFDRVSMVEKGSSSRIGLPPKVHRRSNSDMISTFSRPMQPLSPLIPPLQSSSSLDMPVEGSTWEINNDNDNFDDLFAEYINMENIDVLNSAATEENQECIDTVVSGSKTNGHEDFLAEKMNGVNKGDAPTTRHNKSVSMDSFIGNINIAGASTIALSSPGETLGQSSTVNSVYGHFSLGIGNGMFSDADLNGIRRDTKLAELARTDPKRLKRMLSNRQSAARSKERKKRYIAELEQKVQSLQIEATTLTSQVTQLQRDSDGLTSKNNEMKFRLQAMKEQAQIQDEINNTLAWELERLKLAGGGGNMYWFDQQQK